MPNIIRHQVGLVDKIISALCYLTFGIVSFFCLFAGFLAKRNLKTFVKYHVLQSIFLLFLLLIVYEVLVVVVQICSFIPVIGGIVQTIFVFLTQWPIVIHYSLWNFCTMLLFGYLAIGAMMGELSYLPFVSNIIKSNIVR